MSDFIPTDAQIEMITGASILKLRHKPWKTFGLPDADYRKCGGANQSMLKLMVPRPANVIRFFNGVFKPEFRIGHYTHQGTLTPHDPVPKFVIYPDKCEDGAPWNMARTECKLWVSGHRAGGFEVFTRNEYDEWSGCIRSLIANADVQQMMAKGHPEVSVFVPMELGGIRWISKCRIDWVPDEPYLANLKTVADCHSDPWHFGRTLRDHGYGFQAAYELMCWNAANPKDQRHEYRWPVVEKKPPYVVQWHYALESDLAQYREEVIERLQVFAECLRNRVFPGDSPTFHRIHQ